jgi:PAS domain S-box-containing protein
LTLPLIVGGRLTNIIVMQHTSRHQSWPEDFISRLQLLGNVLVNALEHRQDRIDMEQQLRFEMVVSELSARFVNVPADRVNVEIEAAQQRVCEALGLDMSSLWEWSAKIRDTWELTHLYHPLDGPPIAKGMRASEYFPWCFRKLMAGEVVVVSALEEAPAEAAVDVGSWRQMGIKTTLTIPLRVGSEPPFGALSFNDMRVARTWPELLITRLKLVAQIFANAIVRKRFDQALWESNMRMSLAASAANAGLWELEWDAHCFWVSAKIMELFGLPPGDRLEVDRFIELVHETDRQAVRDVLASASKSYKMILAEYRIVRQDGQVRWMQSRGCLCAQATGNVDRFMGITSDITERKWAEEALRSSEARVLSAIDAADLGFYETGEDSRVVFLDKRIRDLFGIPPDQEPFGREFWLAHIHPDDLPRVEQARRQLLIEGLDRLSVDYRFLHPSRGTLWFHHLARALKRNAEGRPIHAVGVIGDITERKQAEEKLTQTLEEVQRLRDRLEQENVYLQDEIKDRFEQADIVGQSAAIRKVLTQAEQVAPTESTVLILGETGTGKELLARAIHGMSSRKDRPLVTVNCASLPPTLIESELFGREKGAYTGALTRMAGRFEIADGSTLFLDEIGELPLELQVKLLRVLEEGTFERLGSSKPLHVNVRIIAATNRDIAKEVKEGRFRRDLFYRLNVFSVMIPPLRERPDDIPLLVRSFVKDLQKRMGKEIESIPKKTMQALQAYAWPGNIRELRNLIEHAMIVSKGKTLDVLMPKSAASDSETAGSLVDMDRMHIVAVLEKTGWRIAGPGGAAEVLGMKRTTLQAKMTKLGIKRSVKTMPK